MTDVHNCPNCGLQLKPFEPFVVGHVRIDQLGVIYYRSVPVHLPPTQFIIAEALIRSHGRGLLRGFLANLIGPDICEATVTQTIKRLREAFSAVYPRFNEIQCLRGFGAYCWSVPEVQSLPSGRTQPVPIALALTH